MDLQRAEDKINRKGWWDVLRMYDVEEHLINSIRSFHKDKNRLCKLGIIINVGIM